MKFSSSSLFATLTFETTQHLLFTSKSQKRQNSKRLPQLKFNNHPSPITPPPPRGSSHGFRKWGHSELFRNFINRLFSSKTKVFLRKNSKKRTYLHMLNEQVNSDINPVLQKSIERQRPPRLTWNWRPCCCQWIDIIGLSLGINHVWSKICITSIFVIFLED